MTLCLSALCHNIQDSIFLVVQHHDGNTNATRTDDTRRGGGDREELFTYLSTPETP